MKHLIFTIDAAASRRHNALTICFSTAEQEGVRWKRCPSPTSFSPQKLKSLTTAAEHKIISALLHEENVYRSHHNEKKEPLYTSARIDFSRSFEILQCLSATERLFHKGCKVLCDFLHPAALKYEALPSLETYCEVHGCVSWGSKDIPLHDLDLVVRSSQHWCLRGIAIKVFDANIHWKWIEKTLSSPLLLDEKQYEKLVDTIGDNDTTNEPILSVSSKLSSPPPKEEILPHLVLQDRYGAYANLWLTYPDGKKRPFHDIAITASEKERYWERDLLETDFIKKSDGKAHYYCPMDGVVKSLSFLLEMGWEIFDATGKRLLHHTSNDIALQLDDDAVIAHGGITYHEYDATVSEVAQAFRRKENFIRLGIDAIGLLPDTLTHQDLSLLEEGVPHEGTLQIPKSTIGLISTDTLSLSCDEYLSSLCSQLHDFSGIKETLPTKDFNGTLRHYQQDGVNWLSFLCEHNFHGLLADDMGLGKTVQVLAFLSQATHASKKLVIAPTSLLFHWKREIESFLPNFTVYIHAGPSREKDASLWSDNDIVLCSYAILRSDIDILSGITWDYLFLDEAQAIKNPNTLTSKAAYRLEARFRCSITGTPVENSIQDLWSQFHFLMPDLLGAKKAFLSEPVSYFTTQKIRPFLLRRNKEEVAKDLPEKIEQTVLVEMTPHQRSTYETILSKMRSDIVEKVRADGIGKHRIEVFEALLRLRQICCHPELIANILEEETYDSGKFNTLIDDIETVTGEGNKVLVYSQFTSMLSLIERTLKEKDIQYTRLDGTTKDRESVVDAFQNDETIGVFLLSLKAGGVGLNLTAADYVFIYDPWWNLAVENQAIDRAHRIGRKDTVIAKRYVTVNTIEEKIMDIKASKHALVNSILDDKEPFDTMTVEDFCEIFS
jgi:superfamily II DNA or RNA helicase